MNIHSCDEYIFNKVNILHFSYEFSRVFPRFFPFRNLMRLFCEILFHLQFSLRIAII